MSERERIQKMCCIVLNESEDGEMVEKRYVKVRQAEIPVSIYLLVFILRRMKAPAATDGNAHIC